MENVLSKYFNIVHNISEIFTLFYKGNYTGMYF